MKERIEALLPADHPWKNHILVYDTLPSTNDLAKTLARQGAPQGTVILARNQTQGRGRMGRFFHSPQDSGIYMSLILRPHCPPTELMHLTCAVGWAMCQAVEAATGLRPGIKWINDLVYGKRKLGGILTELGFDRSGRASYAIVGIGINCLQAQEDFPPELRDIAGSLAMFCPEAPEPATLAAHMLLCLENMSRNLLTDRQQLLEQYRQCCVTLGQQVIIWRNGQKLEALAVDIDDAGGLMVRFADGREETVTAGEVSVRGMYGYL